MAFAQRSVADGLLLARRSLLRNDFGSNTKFTCCLVFGDCIAMEGANTKAMGRITSRLAAVQKLLDGIKGFDRFGRFGFAFRVYFFRVIFIKNNLLFWKFDLGILYLKI